jgi:phage antirepressor YoqD-like protein
MLQVIQSNSQPKMSSRELSKLADKRHDNTLKLISTLIDGGVLKNTTLSSYLNEQNKQEYPEYLCDKRDSLVIIARLSPEFTAALVDRWQELESSNHQAIPKTFAEALRLAADQQEVIQAQAAQIEHQKPAVEFVERYVESTGNLGFRQVCKLLKAKENDFRAFLQDKQIMYKLAGEWVPYAPHIDAGRFYVTTGTGDNDHNYTSAKFTPKGVEWIAKLWGAK